MVRRRIAAVAAVVAAALLVPGAVVLAGSSGARAVARPHTVTVPGVDKFVPFAMTIHTGDAVQWVNQDTDDHTIVSDDAFNTAGHQGTNHLLPGTDSNGGQPGVFTLTFNRAGQFVYYCRFHSMLDADNQPVAPGPDGGVQGTNGNFGTPMMGVITVRN